MSDQDRITELGFQLAAAKAENEQLRRERDAFAREFGGGNLVLAMTNCQQAKADLASAKANAIPRKELYNIVELCHHAKVHWTNRVFASYIRAAWKDVERLGLEDLVD